MKFLSFKSAFIIFALMICLSACNGSEHLTPHEKSVLVTEEDLSDYGLDIRGMPKGDYKKIINYMDKSTEISYEMDGGELGLYVSSSLTIDTSASNAVVYEKASKAGLMIGLKTAGIVSEPMKGSKVYGNRSSLSLLKIDERPIGNLFTAVVDKKLYIVLFSGFYFDNAQLFDNFILEKMDLVKKYKS